MKSQKELHQMLFGKSKRPKNDIKYNLNLHLGTKLKRILYSKSRNSAPLKTFVRLIVANGHITNGLINAEISRSSLIKYLCDNDADTHFQHVTMSNLMAKLNGVITSDDSKFKAFCVAPRW